VVVYRTFTRAKRGGRGRSGQVRGQDNVREEKRAANSCLWGGSGDVSTIAQGKKKIRYVIRPKGQDEREKGNGLDDGRFRCKEG